MSELSLRKKMIEHCLAMNATGLNQGTSGNLSARYKDAILITPSGIPYEAMKPGDIAAMPIDGDCGAWEGPFKPSSEWRFHLDIMKSRPEVGGVVHTHSTYATILSMTGREIPAGHYMIAAFGGPTIRCAPYRRFGSKELSDAALEALEGRAGCILANHGMIAIGADLDRAMWLAVELETLARQYYHALLIGGPAILSDEEIAEVVEMFRDYGPKDRRGADESERKR